MDLQAWTRSKTGDSVVDLTHLPPPPPPPPPTDQSAGNSGHLVDDTMDRPGRDAIAPMGGRLVPAVTRHWPIWAAVAIIVGTLLARLWIQVYLGSIGVRSDEVGINEQGVIETARVGVGVVVMAAVAVVGYSLLVVFTLTIPLVVPATVLSLAWTVVRGIRTGTWVSHAHPVHLARRIIVWFGIRRWFRRSALAVVGLGVFVVLLHAASQAGDRVQRGDLEDDGWAQIFWFAFPHRPQCITVTGTGSAGESPLQARDIAPDDPSTSPMTRYVWLADHAGITTLLELHEGAKPTVLRVPTDSIVRQHAPGPCLN